MPDLQGHNRQRTTSTGTVESLMICDAWGSEVYGIGGAYLYLRAFGQHGYWRDTASRLYVEQRHLRTDTGLWLSVDPVEGEPAYLYVADRPTWAVDPSGGQGQAAGATDDDVEAYIDKWFLDPRHDMDQPKQDLYTLIRIRSDRREHFLYHGDRERLAHYSPVGREALRRMVARVAPLGLSMLDYKINYDLGAVREATLRSGLTGRYPMFTTRVRSGPTITWGDLSTLDKREFAATVLGPFDHQLTMSAKSNRIPKWLLSTVIINELMDIKSYERFENTDFGMVLAELRTNRSVSIGLGQILPDVALRKGALSRLPIPQGRHSSPPRFLVDIEDAEALRIGTEADSRGDFGPRERRIARGREILVRDRLRTAQFGIEAVARQISYEVWAVMHAPPSSRVRREYLLPAFNSAFRRDRAAADRMFATFGANALASVPKWLVGAPGKVARTTRNVIMVSNSRRAGLLARVVCFAYQGGQPVEGKVDPDARQWEKAVIHGDNASVIAQDLDVLGMAPY